MPSGNSLSIDNEWKEYSNTKEKLKPNKDTKLLAVM
jgi:hypothetical protein